MGWSKPWCLVVAGMLISAEGLADLGADELIDIPLEELMQMDAVVTSASKREERLQDTPSAIFVIAREDIRRSGVTNIPDALRMVPGVQVSRITSTEWAVSARGLGGRFSRYLLVLVDGRSQYTSLFSGVNWDELNVSLENIERIEVIRGPGGTLWGANAVNGVINIITRKGEADNSVQVRLQAGTGEENYSGYAGGEWVLGGGKHLRVSGHHQSMQALKTDVAALPDQDWRNSRADVSFTAQVNQSVVDLRAGLLSMDEQVPWAKQSLTPPGQIAVYGDELKRGYYLALYVESPTEHGQWDWRLSFDETDRDSAVYDWETKNVDAELRWSGHWAQTHEVTAGLYGRWASSFFVPEENGLDVRLNPPEESGTTSSAFIQDSWQLHPQALLSLGLRYDANSLTDSSLQPSLRGLWSINTNQRFWAAVSRAVSTPNRVLNSESEVDIMTLPPSGMNPLPSRISLVSDGSQVPDVELTAYEMGYRWTLSDDLGVDLAAYHHAYDNILGASEIGAPELRQQNGIPYIHLPVYTKGMQSQHGYGVEWSLQYQPSDALYIQYSGTYNQVELPENDSIVGDNLTLASSIPKWQHSVRGLWNVNDKMQFDVWMRHIAAYYKFDAYTVLDARVEYKLSRRLSVSLLARNLGQPITVETTREIFNTGDYGVQPALSLRVEWSVQ